MNEMIKFQNITLTDVNACNLIITSRNFAISVGTENKFFAECWRRNSWWQHLWSNDCDWKPFHKTCDQKMLTIKVTILWYWVSSQWISGWKWCKKISAELFIPSHKLFVPQKTLQKKLGVQLFVQNKMFVISRFDFKILLLPIKIIDNHNLFK